MNRRMAVVASLAATTSAAAQSVAQSVAQRVDAVRDGSVRFAFAARPGVCGTPDGGVNVMNPRRPGAGYWNSRSCEFGPVRVVIERERGHTTSVRERVGGRWPPAADGADLGTVDAAEAARFLLGAAASLGGKSGNEAVAAAAMADAGDLAPELTRLVRNGDAPMDTRKDALFWLGESDIATTDLTRLYDRSQPFALREQWTFVLSQQHDDVALDKLIEIARGDSDVEIRKRAMFWLGQSRDPKAIQFLHDLILR